MIWTPADVYLRFLEAAETLRRLPGAHGPKGFHSTMPDVLRTFGDALAAEPERDKTKWGWSARRQNATPAMVQRCEDVIGWHSRYLATHPAQARVLWGQVICRINRRSFARLCRSRGWSRTTAYRRIDQALQTVADALNAAGVPVIAADVALLEQVVQETLIPDLASGTVARAT
jgi:hypothetical protein